MIDNKTNENQLKEIREKEAEDLAQILSQKYKLPYLDLSKVTIDIDALKLIPENEAKNAKLAVFQKTGDKLQVATQSPNPEEFKTAIKSLEQKGFSVSVYLVSETSLKRAWKRYSEVQIYAQIPKGLVEISTEKITEVLSQSKTIEDLKSSFTSATASKKERKTSEILEILLAGAIGADASDIHIEPQEKTVRLRLRLDGVLNDILFFDYDIYSLLLSRIKLVSGLKLNIHDQAQDGRFSINLNNTEIEIRTSIIPENYGESVVMRILNPKSIAVDFENLGIEKKLMEILSKELKKPNGMILTTGPTGSGKTTTLYAFLKKIYTPEIKIITLEDPIEYHLQGIIQTQTEEEKGYDFSSGLRAILRQDPDVIMVGEIRDAETAKIAVNAALTGHLVLSTLHTNNAAGTIPRLIDLGINPNAIAPAVNVAMAQRLVRKLCLKCKEEYQANAEETATIQKAINSIPEKHRQGLTLENIKLWKAKGCEECNGTGYKSRIGIYEAILIDDAIETTILEKPSEAEIAKTAKQQEILDMKQDGILKVLNGVTSLDELQRVVEL